MASDPGVLRRATAGVADGLWLDGGTGQNPCDSTHNFAKGTRSEVCL